MLISVTGGEDDFEFIKFAFYAVFNLYHIMIDWYSITSQIATIIFDILYFGIIIGIIVIIILDNRNPVKTMSWILVLLFLPVVGLIFYFFFQAKT